MAVTACEKTKMTKKAWDALIGIAEAAILGTLCGPLEFGANDGETLGRPTKSFVLDTLHVNGQLGPVAVTGER